VSSRTADATLLDTKQTFLRNNNLGHRLNLVFDSMPQILILIQSTGLMNPPPPAAAKKGSRFYQLYHAYMNDSYVNISDLPSKKSQST
jgi:hypothetical protein